MTRTAKLPTIECPAHPDPVFLSALHEAGFQNRRERKWDVRAMEEMLAMPGVFVHQSAAGFVMTRLCFEQAEIMTFAVHPGQRNRGHGTALLRAAMRHAGQNGAARMFLEVASDRQAALRLYRRMGFKKSGVRKNYYAGPDGGRDAVLMETGLERGPILGKQNYV